MPGEPGDAVTLDTVLLVVDDGQVVVGTPKVKGAQVKTTLEAQIKGEKLVVFKYRPKKRIRVKTGHRQKYTRLKIDSILVE